MPLTFTGRLVTPEGPAHPSLTDIAIGLSRQPRFGGQTRSWWSVLDHSLYCDELVRADLRTSGHPPLPGAYDDEENTRMARMAVLLHDAHEALTGDVPTPLKTDDFKAMQNQLDTRIYNAFYPGGAGYYHGEARELVKDVDRRALSAEAYTFLPHGTEIISRHFATPSQRALEALSFYMGYDYAAVPPLAHRQEEHPAVREYLRRMLELL